MRFLERSVRAGQETTCHFLSDHLHLVWRLGMAKDDDGLWQSQPNRYAIYWMLLLGKCPFSGTSAGKSEQCLSTGGFMPSEALWPPGTCNFPQNWPSWWLAQLQSSPRLLLLLLFLLPDLWSKLVLLARRSFAGQFVLLPNSFLAQNNIASIFSYLPLVYSEQASNTLCHCKIPKKR